jgi:hypothetical protein
MSANTLPSIFLLAVVGMLAGCGESKSDGGAPQSGANAAPATKPGSDTPQQAFEAARSALAKKDPKAMLDSGHPSQRQVFLAQFVMMGGMGTMGNEEKGKAFDALLQKHSVVADKTKSPLMIQDQAARTQALDQMFAGVKDQAALLGDLMQFVGDGMKMEIAPDAKLEGLTENGDTASATAVDGKGTRMPMQFKKHEGRWYMSAPGR